MSKNDLQLSKPPLNLLLNPTVLKAKKPWEIDVVLLLELFTDFLEKKGDKNLRLCANAALSSSLLYRLKVETFFIFEKLRNEQPLSNLADPPELLSLPYRYELYSTTLIDLLESLRTEIERALETLTPREADVVRLYFGLGNQHAMTLEEIGETFDLTRERVRQIKEKAIRRLKHTSRSKILKTYLG